MVAHEPSAGSGKPPVLERYHTQTSMTTSDDEAYGLDRSHPLSNEEISELNTLAQYLSRSQTQATRTAPSTRPSFSWADTAASNALELSSGDPRLDPTRPEFDRAVLIRAVASALKEEGIMPSSCGVLFQALNVSGVGAEIQYQDTVGGLFAAPFRWRENSSSGHEKKILHNFEGLVREGEMLIVLGRPGSGCSTFLKSICGELQGLKKAKDSIIQYNGLDQEIFNKEFRGEAVYNQEQEKHFPHLTVGETLEFAAAARAPSSRLAGTTREQYIKGMATLMMAIFGLSHTRNTKVGNDFIRGVSGGERKRVSLAEMALAGSKIAAWDNSTRGLDSATALEFVRSLRSGATMFGVTHAVAIYQASQSIYDLFDKTIVLYEGRQIYFGPASRARRYFEQMGWYCPPRQTTGDFLTSVTNPAERQTRDGFEDRIPRTPEDFERYWLQSAERKESLQEVEAAKLQYSDKETYNTLREGHEKAICTKRAYQRLWNDKVSTITAVGGNIVMALIIASIYYGTPLSTSSFFSKGAILFFAVLLNALSSITEINMLYEQRPIVEKHASYAFCHPFTEALAGIVSDLPIKFISGVCFNITIYFLGGLTYTASKFFIFFLFIFITTLTMSAVFRTMAAATKTISQAMALAGVSVLAIVTYTGFTLSKPYQHYWLFWLQYINPVSFAYEALLTNEVHGASYECSNVIPPHGTGQNFICGVGGAEVGQRFVNGDAWVEATYQYTYARTWRNLGIIIAFLIFFYAAYLLATEINSKSTSTAEFLVFRRGSGPSRAQPTATDEEKNTTSAVTTSSGEVSAQELTTVLAPQKDVFTWRNVTLDINIKGEPRRLLDDVSGWVKPGTLTALMGTSGAGKTTLLDTLAQRMSIGVLTGEMLVNGKALPASFQRNTGYVQQQDLHLETSTVREALRFSAMLRQPKSVSTTEKHSFVEDVIHMLGMEDFAEAVVGNPGEGLNVEQRKLLTIGVELAAKPDLLLFLDEPTSGLDSQSSWSICAFLRKLADNGQAILATIHQPSAILFQQFDRLLFLAKGDRTVYFGEIGENSRTLLTYFEQNGARKCLEEENPAEYMLEIIGAGGHASVQDWPVVWRESQEAKEVQNALDRIHEDKKNQESKAAASNTEYAMPFTSQLYHVTYRVFQQYWRTPQYISGKFMLGIMAALFIGFSFFLQRPSQTGVQNQIFAIFMLCSTFSTLVQQIMPQFVIQRSLYEVRERPSKTYSWVVFLMSNIFVEIPYQAFLGLLVWAAWYFPVFGKDQSSEQMGLTLLYCIIFQLFTSTFAQALIAGLPDAATAGTLATLMFSLTLTFNGVLQPPSSLPGFWLFMYRVSPLTYLIGGQAATGIHNRSIVCTDTELAVFDPPSGQTCGQYLAPYLQQAPGYLENSAASAACRYCPLSNSDQFLAGSSIYWDQRWRNFGILWAYIAFNVYAAVTLYYMARVKRWDNSKKPPKPSVTIKRMYQGTKIARKIFTDKEEVPLSKKKTNDRVF